MSRRGHSASRPGIASLCQQVCHSRACLKRTSETACTAPRSLRSVRSTPFRPRSGSPVLARPSGNTPLLRAMPSFPGLGSGGARHDTRLWAVCCARLSIRQGGALQRAPGLADSSPPPPFFGLETRTTPVAVRRSLADMRRNLHSSATTSIVIDAARGVGGTAPALGTREGDSAFVLRRRRRGADGQARGGRGGS